MNRTTDYNSLDDANGSTAERRPSDTDRQSHLRDNFDDLFLVQQDIETLHDAPHQGNDRFTGYIIHANYDLSYEQTAARTSEGFMSQMATADSPGHGYHEYYVYVPAFARSLPYVDLKEFHDLGAHRDLAEQGAKNLTANTVKYLKILKKISRFQRFYISAESARAVKRTQVLCEVKISNMKEPSKGYFLRVAN